MEICVDDERNLYMDISGLLEKATDDLHRELLKTKALEYAEYVKEAVKHDLSDLAKFNTKNYLFYVKSTEIVIED